MFNFYTLIKKNYDIPNPNYDLHKIELPARILIAGPSGSMKTSALLNLFVLFGDDTFNKLILCVKSADEPLYNHVIDKLPEELVTVYENGDVPPRDAELKEVVGKKKKKVPFMKFIVFDDLLYENQSEIKNYYIYGRKSFYTMCYISQAYHKTPVDIRKNCQYFILAKGLLNRDLNLILSEFSFGYDKDYVIDKYKEITKEAGHIMLFDTIKQEIRIDFINVLPKQVNSKGEVIEI
jgi:hypothetical protein